MKVLLTVPAEAGLDVKDSAAENIEVYGDDELDGASVVNAILDLAPYLPIIAGSAAATLAAVNKSIDEMNILVKRFLQESPSKSRSGVFENGQRVLAPNATEAEIDVYFADLKSRAANESRDGD